MSASSEPVTSALRTRFSVATSPCWICSKMSSSLAPPPVTAASRPRLATRCQCSRVSATDRASFSSGATMNWSPASATSLRPSTWTGIDGPASFTFSPWSSIERADPAPGGAGHQRIADPQRSPLHEHGGHRAPADVEVGFQHHARRTALGARGDRRVLEVGHQQQGLQQLVDTLARQRGHRHHLGVAAPVAGDEVLLGELLLHAIGVGLLAVDLVDGHHDGDLGRLGVVQRLDRLGHDPVVRGHDEHDDVGGLRTPGAHGGERLVAGRVDERDATAVLLGLVGADVLGDATGLALDDVGVADAVEQLGLAVIDVAHDGDDRRARLELAVAVVGEQLLDAELALQLDLLLLARVDQPYLRTDLGREQLDHVVGQRLRGRHHLALRHQEADDVGRRAVELGAEILRRRCAFEDDDALGYGGGRRRVRRRLHGLQLFTAAAAASPTAGRCALRATGTATGTTARATGSGATHGRGAAAGSATGTATEGTTGAPGAGTTGAGADTGSAAVGRTARRRGRALAGGWWGLGHPGRAGAGWACPTMTRAGRGAAGWARRTATRALGALRARDGRAPAHRSDRPVPGSGCRGRRSRGALAGRDRGGRTGGCGGPGRCGGSAVEIGPAYRALAAGRGDEPARRRRRRRAGGCGPRGCRRRYRASPARRARAVRLVSRRPPRQRPGVRRGHQPARVAPGPRPDSAAERQARAAARALPSRARPRRRVPASPPRPSSCPPPSWRAAFLAAAFLAGAFLAGGLVAVGRVVGSVGRSLAARCLGLVVAHQAVALGATADAIGLRLLDT